MENNNQPIIATGDETNGQSVVVAESAPTFEQVKEDVIARCKKHGACQPEFKRILDSSDFQSLLQVLKDNMNWCLKEKMIDADYLELMFGKELLWSNHIYTSGTNSVRLSEAKAVVVTLGSSQNTIKSWDSSQNTIESWDSSQNTIKSLGSSQNTIKSWDSSQNTIESWDSSQNTIESWDSSQNTIKSWDSSQNTAAVGASSSAHIADYNSAKTKYELTDGDCPLIKHLTEKKVFVKTSAFTIEQIN